MARPKKFALPEKVRVRAKAKITSKGQITLPKAVREYFSLKPGDEIEFVEDEKGMHVRRIVDPHRLDKWIGFLKEFEGRSSDELVEEMRGR
jgi:AbrB family looped-hinge helix DNA binding protein